MSDYVNNLVIKLLEDGYEFDLIMEIVNESKDDEEVLEKLKKKIKINENPLNQPEIPISASSNESENIGSLSKEKGNEKEDNVRGSEDQEKLNKEKQDRINRERQEKFNIERQEMLKKEREEKLNKEREEMLKKEREEKLKKEKEEKLYKERQEKINKEREDKYNKEKQEKLNKEREDKARAEMRNNKKEGSINTQEIPSNGLKSIRRKIPNRPGKTMLKYYNFDTINQSRNKGQKFKRNLSNKLSLKVYKFSDSSEPYLSSKIYQLFLQEKQAIGGNKQNEPQRNQSSRIFTSKQSEIYSYLISKNVPIKIARSIAESTNSKEEALTLYNSQYTKSNISANSSQLLSRAISSQQSSRSFQIKPSPKKNEPEEKVDPELIYYESLSNLKIFACSNKDAFGSYSFIKKFKLSSFGLNRMNEEFAELSTNLPCSLSMSAFFMYDYEDACKIRALISGPENTVYAHGLYLFDILIPEGYPNEPPLVSFLTTADGYFVFNPCFGANSNVRIPVANSFNGNSATNWIPGRSTLMDVFRCIEEVFKNRNIVQYEPGFEKLAVNSPENILFQYEALYGNFEYAIIKNLIKPPIGFEKIVKKHFSLKKDSIIMMINELINNINQFIPKKGIKSKNPQIQAVLENDPRKVFKKIAFKLDEVLNNKREEA